MKEEIRCGAQIKVRGRWMQCTHAQGHGGRHTYYTKKKGYRFFTAKRYVVTRKKVKSDAIFEIKVPHVYGGYHVDPKNGDDKGDGSPARPLKTSEAAKLLYLKHGVRLNLSPTAAFAEAAKGWEEMLKVSDDLKEAAAGEGAKVIRVPVKYRYDAIHPEFLKMLAEIGSYADGKYGAWSQYLGARLTGNAAPVNHIYEHLRSYQMLERYDHFEGDPRRHLAAIAYNAMMEFVAFTKWGPAQSEHAKGIDMHPWPLPVATSIDSIMVSKGDVEDRLVVEQRKRRRKKRR